MKHYTLFALVKEVFPQNTSCRFGFCPLMAVRVVENRSIILERVLMWSKTNSGVTYIWRTRPKGKTLTVYPQAHWKVVPLKSFLTSAHLQIRKIVKEALKAGFDKVFLSPYDNVYL